MLLHTTRRDEHEVLEWEEASHLTDLLANLGRTRHRVIVPRTWMHSVPWEAVERLQRAWADAQALLWVRGMETRAETIMGGEHDGAYVFEWRPEPVRSPATETADIRFRASTLYGLAVKDTPRIVLGSPLTP